MDWQGQGVICAIARHGEHGAIVRLLSDEHGLHAGYVAGGMGRRLRPLLEPGNSALVSWRARTADQLGNFTLESLSMRTARVLDDADRLAGFSALCATVAAALPERMAAANIHHALVTTLDMIADDAMPPHHWLAALTRFELGLLAELGYGLDLSRCAVTGSRDDLVYVSPKSARAVSRAAGAPYAGRLLALPGFLLSVQAGEPDAKALGDALALTGYFLDHHVFAPKNIAEPPARQRLRERLTRWGGKPSTAP